MMEMEIFIEGSIFYLIVHILTAILTHISLQSGVQFLVATGKKRASFQLIGVLSVRQAHQKVTELCVVIILRRDIKMNYYYAIYRCKYCDEEFGNIVGDETKNTVNELINMFEGTHAIHHCDSDHRCLADFIGIEIVEDK
jgi:hypothetical protein